MNDSVHDNWIYAHTVDYERCRVVVHTVYPHVEPSEYTDIVFDGVVVHHFEQQAMSNGPNPANVLFDVTEAPACNVLETNRLLLERLRNYGWPVFHWSDLKDLANQLAADGAKCFEIHGTCGLHGFVFAASMELRFRLARAEVSGAEFRHS